MTTLVEILPIYEGGQGHCQTIPQLLLVSKTNLTGVVYLSPHTAILVQDVLDSHTKAGGAAGSCPAKVNSSLNIRVNLTLKNKIASFFKHCCYVYLLIHGGSKDGSIINI